MRRSSGWMCVAVALLLLLPLGCKSQQEKAHAKVINLIGEVADLLSSVKSNTDFVDAKPKLERLGAKLKDAINEGKNLPEPTAQERKALDEKYESQAKQVNRRLQDELERLGKIGVSPFDVLGALHVDPTLMLGD